MQEFLEKEPVPPKASPRNELIKNPLKSIPFHPPRLNFLKQTIERVGRGKKTLKIALGVAALAAILFFAAPLLLAGAPQNDRIALFFKESGFENVQIPAPLKKNGALIFENIALDPDGFSSIKTLTLHTGFLGGWKRVTIDGLSLTGELLNDFEIALAGWDKNKINTGTLQSANLPLIAFQNARIALLSDSIGGININFDLQLRPKDTGYEFQAKLRGEQVSFSYTADANGTLKADGSWQAQADIAQAKFALWPLKATRISGTIKGSGQGLLQSQILGDLQAGGLNINGLPWRNIALTLDGTLQKTRMVIGAKSAGIDGMDLSLTLDEIQSPKIYSGTLFAHSMGALFDYLNARDLLLMERKKLAPLDTLEAVTFSFKGSPRTLVFKAQSEDTILLSQGQLEPKEIQYTLQDLQNGIAMDLFLKAPEDDFKSTIALSDDRKNLVTLPGRKTLSPKLNEQSTLLDIFR
jgi:hypothetical protein